MTEEQKNVMYNLVGQALGENPDEEEDDEEVKHNVFDREEMQQGSILSHSDEEAIVALAKQSNVGSLQAAMKIYADEHGDNLAQVYSVMVILKNCFRNMNCLKKVNRRRSKEIRHGLRL